MNRSKLIPIEKHRLRTTQTWQLAPGAAGFWLFARSVNLRQGFHLKSPGVLGNLGRFISNKRLTFRKRPAIALAPALDKDDARLCAANGDPLGEERPWLCQSTDTRSFCARAP